MKKDLPSTTIAIVIGLVVLVVVVAGYFYVSGGQGSYRPLPKAANRMDMIRQLHGATTGGPTAPSSSPTAPSRGQTAGAQKTD